MAARNPLLQRIYRHRGLSVLFRSLENPEAGGGSSAGVQPAGRDNLETGGVRASLIAPSSQLPEGQVVELWTHGRGAGKGEPWPGNRQLSYPTFAPPSPEEPSPARSHRTVLGRPVETEPVGDRISPEAEKEEPLQSIQGKYEPGTPGAEGPDKVEAEAEKKNWRRLETIIQRHREVRGEISRVTEVRATAKAKKQEIPGSDDPEEETRPMTAQKAQDGQAARGESLRSGAAQEEAADTGDQPFERSGVDLPGAELAAPEIYRDIHKEPQPPPQSSPGDTTLISRRPAKAELGPTQDFSSPADSQEALAGRTSGPDTLPPGDLSASSPITDEYEGTPAPDQPNLERQRDDPQPLLDPELETAQFEEGSGSEGETASQDIPLEAAWPVQRNTEPASPPAGEPPGTAETGHVGRTRSLSPVSDQPEMTVLRSAPPGQATLSPIEILPVRRPRPQASPPPARTTPSRQPGERSSEPTMVQQENEMEPGREPVEQETIPTGIGPLPADLWTLIGKNPPRAAETAEESLTTPVPGTRDPQPEEDRVQRAVRAAESPYPADDPEHAPESGDARTKVEMDAQSPVQRAVSGRQPPSPGHADTEQAQAGEAEAGGTVDIEALARQVYPEIRRRLALEWERTRREFL